MHVHALLSSEDVSYLMRISVDNTDKTTACIELVIRLPVVRVACGRGGSSHHLDHCGTRTADSLSSTTPFHVVHCGEMAGNVWKVVGSGTDDRDPSWSSNLR